MGSFKWYIVVCGKVYLLPCTFNTLEHDHFSGLSTFMVCGVSLADYGVAVCLRQNRLYSWWKKNENLSAFVISKIVPDGHTSLAYLLNESSWTDCISCQWWVTALWWCSVGWDFCSITEGLEEHFPLCKLWRPAGKDSAEVITKTCRGVSRK